jgi:hypothetical protein
MMRAIHPRIPPTIAPILVPDKLPFTSPFDVELKSILAVIKRPEMEDSGLENIDCPDVDNIEAAVFVDVC